MLKNAAPLRPGHDDDDDDDYGYCLMAARLD